MPPGEPIAPHPDWAHAAPERVLTLAPLGIPIELYEWGDPGAPPLVLVHGFLDHGRGFEPIAPLLARNHRVIAYDARGHGRSGWSDGYAWPIDVLELVAILRWIGRPCGLIGHSRGGGMATDAALIAPECVEKLVNIDGFGPPPEGFGTAGRDAPAPGRLDHFRRFLDQRQGTDGRRGWRSYDKLEDLVERRRSQTPRLEGSWLEHFVRIGALRCEQGYVWRADPMVLGGAGPWKIDWVARQWPSLRVPMLAVIGSEQDTWGPLPESIIGPRLARIPKLERATILGAGHFVHMEQPDSFAELALDWFAR